MAFIEAITIVNSVYSISMKESTWHTHVSFEIDKWTLFNFKWHSRSLGIDYRSEKLYDDIYERFPSEGLLKEALSLKCEKELPELEHTIELEWIN